MIEPKLKPYSWQAAAISRLLGSRAYALFWEMRVGKSKAVLDAFSYAVATARAIRGGIVPNMIVVCPSQVKDVWADDDLGEIKKHCFISGMWSKVTYDGDLKKEIIPFLTETGDPTFVVTGYEFLRQTDAFGKYFKAEDLVKMMGGRPFWVVADEGSALANWKAESYRAVQVLRDASSKFILLDGTPTETGLMTQYAKFKMLDPTILGYKNFYHFRAVHADLGGFKGKTVIAFKNQNIIDRKVKPFCEVLTQKDCGLELPEKVMSFLPVRLGKRSWSAYIEMRDTLVAQLDDKTVSVQTAAVKVLRLAQICAGFLGGWDDPTLMSPADDDTQALKSMKTVIEVGDETAKAVEEWLKKRLEENPNFKCVVWARWRPELERLATMTRLIKVPSGSAWGGVKEYDDQLHGDSKPHVGPFVLVAQPQALKFGTNLSQAGTEIYASKDYNLVTRRQSLERLQAPNGRKSTYVLDVLVSGPHGEKTVTHDIQRTLDDRGSIATRTAAEWKKILTS